MQDSVLRENLVGLLRGGNASVTVERALDNLKPQLRNSATAPGQKSIWEELEHMLLAQEDILRYTLEPSWVSPEFPAGYWPSGPEQCTEESWNDTVAGFLKNRNELIELIQSPDLDLTSQIPHGGGHTYLREVLLVADHNAYHLGQIVQTRKLLGDWPG